MMIDQQPNMKEEEEHAPPTPTSAPEVPQTSGAEIPTPKGLTRKKRSKSFSLLKAALNIFQEKPNEGDNETPKKPKKKRNDWKTVVGSMRPLTLQDRSPTASMSPSASFDNLQQLDMTGSPSPSYMSSSSGTMSRYASAGNLQELDSGSDPDDVFENAYADEMIDVKAKEFIAQFYRNLKLEQQRQHV